MHCYEEVLDTLDCLACCTLEVIRKTSRSRDRFESSDPSSYEVLPGLTHVVFLDIAWHALSLLTYLSDWSEGLWSGYTN